MKTPAELLAELKRAAHAGDLQAIVFLKTFHPWLGRQPRPVSAPAAAPLGSDAPAPR